MIILVCNVGSTSLKFKLYQFTDDTGAGSSAEKLTLCKPTVYALLARAGVELVGSDHDAIFFYRNEQTGEECRLSAQNIPDYRTGIEFFLKYLTASGTGVIGDVSEIGRVGFKATLSRGHLGLHKLDEDCLQGMKDWIAMAPLHNRAYLSAIEVMREVLPDALFVGAFETAFHRDIPLERKLFGVPYEWYERYGVQRLGYHSASHSYIADVLREREGETYSAISCHLGGSCSVCAIENGRSVDISFGMSLESGLIHANRVGDIDSGMIWFLRNQGLSEEEIRQGFQKQGGLLGISGVSNDLRYVLDAARAGNERARLAVGVFVTGIVHYIGAFYLDLGRLDDLVFTAGIGEHSPEIRQMVCERLQPLGVQIDPALNENVPADGLISAPGSAVKVLVIPTDEELGIARRTYEFH